jgi:hypothetical protein
MRKLFTVLMTAFILYFVYGYIAVYFNLSNLDDYSKYSGIVGSLASVAGLYALTRKPFSQSDIQAIEVETLRSMAETTEELKTLQNAHAKTVEEIGSLEVTRKEMELLVKKASLALFLKEQYSYQEKQVLDELSKNSTLQLSLEKAVESFNKLQALEEEIQVHPNVKQLREIIKSASRRPTIDEAIESLPPSTRALFEFAQNLSRFLFGSSVR